MTGKIVFAKYLEKIGLSKSAVRQYSNYYLEEESLKKLAKDVYGVNSIYELTDVARIESLYEQAKDLPINKKWNNGLTAALKKYSDFIKSNNKQLMEEVILKNIELLQIIFFGAPGTGKSHKIDYDLFKNENGVLDAFVNFWKVLL